MMLPEGWVIDVPGIKRTEALKMLGNGVVPRQAAMAIRWAVELIDDIRARDALDDMEA